MKATTLLAAFLGGALVGAGAALICRCTREEEFEEIVDQIAEEIKEAKR